MIAVHHLRDLDIDPTTHPRGRTYLSAASGLIQVGDRLYVVADDEHYLAVFDALAPDVPGQLVWLFDGDLPESPKKRKARKPDIEALARLPPWPDCPEGALLGLGSGSRPNRNVGVLLPLGADGSLKASVRHIDLSPLYTLLITHFTELNIEGGFVKGDELVLLQRGNKSGSANACIHYAWADLLPWLLGHSSAPLEPRCVRRYDLGEIAGVPLCFTDGTPLPGGGWVFSAVAEDTESSYDDGPFAGASIGIVDAEGTVRSMHALPPGLKVEGIAASLDPGELSLTMVTDADDPAIPSHLLTATVSVAGTT